MTLPVPAFFLCIFLSGTLSSLCVSLSGTPSCLVHVLIRHPFLSCVYPYPTPFLPCASHPAPLPALYISLSGTLPALCISSGTPSCLVHLLIRHSFLLCISLSGTPSCLVHLLIRHPFLPSCYPFHNIPFPSELRLTLL